jgi:beta-galactosidase
MSTGALPDGFLWGASTAAYQIEGGAREDGRGPSTWDAFTLIPGRTAKGETGEIACDHYHRWREDVALMQALNLRSYRFSISWPRVMPRGRGGTNAAGLDFYDRLVDALCAARIEPLVTLYHWDLPLALQLELNGWEHDDLPKLFADYAELMFSRLGDRVKYWLTLNEPWVSVDAGYFHGVHAPGIKDIRRGYIAGHNLLRAHAYAVARYRASTTGGGKIGFALNAPYFFPASTSKADTDAAERALVAFAGWFNDPPWVGDYPALMRERLGALLPTFSDEDSRLLRGSINLIALNYYFSEVVRHQDGAGAFDYAIVPQTHLPRTEMGWPLTPDGLIELLVWLHRRYPGLPFYITENGAAMKDEADAAGWVNDQDRIAYLRDHIAACLAARRRGVDLRGYFVWSLIDNLEWSAGYDKRFGLIRCAPETQVRTIKASGHWYAQQIAAGRWDFPPPPATPLRGV